MKENLEKKKLELEIKKLEVSWFNNIEFWKVIIPTLAVLISLYFTFGKGILDTEKSKLEIQKEQLKLDITRFEIKKDELTKTITIKDDTKNKLEKQIIDYELQRKELIDKISILNSKLKGTGLEIERANTERIKDKKYYQDKLLEDYKQEKTRLDELEKLKSNLYSSNVVIATLNAEIEFLSPKIKLSEYEKTSLEIKKLSASSSEREKQISTYKKSMEKLNEKYEAEKKRINEMSIDDNLKELELNFLKYNIDNKE